MTEAEYKLESKLWKALKDDRTVMLGLAGVEEGHSQPMTAQTLHDEDERGPIWFFTSKDTDLVKALTDSHRAVVHFGDLNLNSQAGVVSLHKRIRNAAESVCSPLDLRVLGLRDQYDECVKEAVENGVTAVANPNLSNFHASKGKREVLASN